MYVGCFIDSFVRVLSGFADLTGYPGYNSLYYCQQQALLNGAYYFGMQFSTYCYFGLQSVNLTTYGAVRNDTECNMVCTGADTNAAAYGPNCGGIWRNSVYSVGVNYFIFIALYELACTWS